MGLEERRQTKLIDGVTYESQPLPTGLGIKVFNRVIKVIGPTFGAVTKETSQMAMLGALLEALPMALSDEDVDYLRQTFGTASWYQNGGNSVPLVMQNQEQHFAGRYPALLGWLVFNIEVNFSGFLDGTKSGNVGESLKKMFLK